jgi:S-adenosylmethionine:tRNA ribosyltransferase-isomerase
MVVCDHRIEHKTFLDLAEYLGEKDVLVLNDSKVVLARLFGRKKTGGKIEALMVKKMYEKTWECFIKGKNIRPGTQLYFGDNKLSGTVKSKLEGGRYAVEFPSEDNLKELIQDIGKMPIPPYIKEIPKEQDRYQTVYAKKNGSIAAPTAGLHFTDSFLKALEAKGVETVKVTLHVSTGTFLPVKSEDIMEHKMEPEHLKIEAEAARRINLAKKDKRKIFAVGTTAVKALESACNEKGEISKMEGESDLFIYPGYKFKFELDGLLTNFHLPKSTLLMLVCAFTDKATILKAYKAAIEHSYRFYSFGDAMLLLKG